MIASGQQQQGGAVLAFLCFSSSVGDAVPAGVVQERQVLC
jgi:hypothetical protein